MRFKKKELSKDLPPEVIKEPKSSSIFTFIVQTILVGVAFFVVGFSLGQRQVEITKKGFIPKINVTNKLPPREQTVDFSLFWEVFGILPEKYIDKSAIDGQKLLYGAISGMVRSLGDPYTAFLDPKQSETIRAEISGLYEGVGIQIGFNKQKRLVVIAPLKGTPAQQAGLRAKDLILKIGERETFDLTLPEAVDLIRGPAGSKVKLVLQREDSDDTFEREITRARIEVKSVEVEYRQAKKGEVAVVKVSRFGDKTDAEWDRVVDEILQRKVVGIVVDMRNNPGGLLSSSVHLASEFVRGAIVRQELADGSDGSLSADHQGRLLKKPLVVLVNDGSASASEIFAGAIQDGRRGKIVGEQTFGKGTVQDVVELSGKTGLHITIAKWFTPKGNSIDKVGITPEVIVESPKDTEEGVDPQLEKTLEVLNL